MKLGNFFFQKVRSTMYIYEKKVIVWWCEVGIVVQLQKSFSFPKKLELVFLPKTYHLYHQTMIISEALDFQKKSYSTFFWWTWNLIEKLDQARSFCFLISIVVATATSEEVNSTSKLGFWLIFHFLASSLEVI